MKHIFDLDLTIWEVSNKHGNLIWAKQLIFPLVAKTDSLILDDVGSRCVLRPGIREFLDHLYGRAHEVGFISAGRHWNFDDLHQPSIHLLNMFGLMKYFNDVRILTYKDVKKSTHFHGKDCRLVFYDDDDEVIRDLSAVQGIQIIDAKKINDWSLMIRKYD